MQDNKDINKEEKAVKNTKQVKKQRKPLTEKQKQIITIASVVVAVILVLSIILAIVLLGSSDNGTDNNGGNNSGDGTTSDNTSTGGNDFPGFSDDGIELPIIPLD